jgi:4-amino-4-deoxy-L-arabinose transferase-like glycosyltransferase
VVTGLFLAAFLLRWIYAARTNIYTYDSYYYLTLGRNLLHGFSYSIRGVPHQKFLPLYPATIALATLLLRNPELAGKLVNTLCFSLAVFPVYGMGKRCFSEAAGIAAATIYVFEPLSVVWASLPMSEGLFVLLVCLCAFLFIRWFQGGKDLFLYGAALAGGLSAVTRWEGLLVLLVLLPPLIYSLRMRGGWIRLFYAGLIFLSPFILWSLRNLVVFGNPLKTSYASEAVNHPGEWSPFTTWERLQRYLFFGGLSPIRYTTHFYNYGILLAGYLGFFLMAASRRSRRYLFLLLPWLLLLGPFHFLWYYLASRFLVGAVPALCLGGGYTIWMPFLLASLSGARGAARWGVVALSLFLVAIICLGSFPVIRDMHESYILRMEDDAGGLASKAAFLWMKENLPSDAVVASNAGPLASFYLGRDALFLGSWYDVDPADVPLGDGLLEGLREKDVSYVVLYSTSGSLGDALREAGITGRYEEYFHLVHLECAGPRIDYNREAYALVLEVDRGKAARE